VQVGGDRGSGTQPTCAARPRRGRGGRRGWRRGGGGGGGWVLGGAHDGDRRSTHIAPLRHQRRLAGIGGCRHASFRARRHQGRDLGARSRHSSTATSAARCGCCSRGA